MHIAGRMGLSLRDFAAVGDSRSDIPMFELAGFRAAVGNADRKLKAVSDFVALAEYGVGFAEIVDFMAEQKLL